jgi:hypothetical protein
MRLSSVDVIYFDVELPNAIVSIHALMTCMYVLNEYFVHTEGKSTRRWGMPTQIDFGVGRFLRLLISAVSQPPDFQC